METSDPRATIEKSDYFCADFSSAILSQAGDKALQEEGLKFMKAKVTVTSPIAHQPDK